jgi:hypothetical protein
MVVKGVELIVHEPKRGGADHMTAARSWFSIDVDNTLLNNDRVQMTFCSILSGEFGAANRQRYWRYSRSCERNLVMPTIWARVNGCKPRAKKRSDQAGRK